MHGIKVHLVAGRYHCHEVTLVVFQHDALGHSIPGNVSGLRRVAAIPSTFVRDDVVVHAFAGQTVLHGCRNTHDDLLVLPPPGPMRASAVSRFAGTLRGLESCRLLGSSGGIASTIGVGPGSGKLAALHDQVFTADRPALGPTLLNLAHTRRIS